MEPAETRSFFALCSDALEKGVEKLWAGLGVLCVREVPFVACKFVVFDVASKALFEAWPDAAEDGLSSLAVYAFAGFIAGLVAAVVSHPADVLLTRIADAADDTSSGRDFPPRPAARLAVWLRGGGSGSVDVWRGLGSRSLYFAATICAQFLIYTSVKELLGVGADDLRLVLDVFGISTRAESMMGSVG